jgi:hypothetical protein
VRRVAVDGVLEAQPRSERTLLRLGLLDPDLRSTGTATAEVAGRVAAHRLVLIGVSAPHRQDALAACKDAIDMLKQTVPLWKKEVYEGGEEWLGRGS